MEATYRQTSFGRTHEVIIALTMQENPCEGQVSHFSQKSLSLRVEDMRICIARLQQLYHVLEWTSLELLLEISHKPCRLHYP